MSEPFETKFITTTKSGSKIKSPITIHYTGGRIEFLKSPFSLKDELKAFKGSRWHGYDPNNPRKIWSALDCERNHFQIQWLMGEDAYSWWDRPLKQFECDRPLYEHQKLMTNHMLTYHFCIIAAEMGCIDGDAIVKVSRPTACGSTKAYNMTMRELYQRVTGTYECRGRKWDALIPTLIYALKEDSFGLVPIVNVLSKGVKPVVKVILTDGRSIVVTYDHEMYMSWNVKKEARLLIKGDKLVVTGTCDNLDKLPSREKLSPIWDGIKKTSLGTWARLNSEGYVEVGSFSSQYPYGWRMKNGHKVVKEQYLIMEEFLGYVVPPKFVIHHLNGIKHDNRIENLALLKDTSHRSLHGSTNTLKRSDRLLWQPCYGTVEKVIDYGETDVYDIVCDHPYHNFVCSDFVVSNCGKTLSAIECMEKSKWDTFWWVGPKSALKAVEREFDKWGLSSDINLELMTYERLRSIMKGWKDGDVPPPGVIFDESSRIKSASAQRTTAAQNLADSIREQYGKDGYAILMSGTPSPKSPVDWWSQGEVAWPGFIREGSAQAFERRMGIFVEKETMQGKHLQRVTWLDDEDKCKHCGGYGEDHNEDHKFEPSLNEVSYLHERLQGLTLVLRKKDCLDLPEKQYRTIKLTPSTTLNRVAKALVKVAPNVITGLTWLRELSDGFQYQDVEKGTEKCPVCEDGVVGVWIDPEDSSHVFEMVDMLDSEYVATLKKKQVECSRCGGTQEVPKIVRIAREIPCPKDDAIRQLLEENEEQGRLVFFAGFTGSIDRITANCLKQHWAVVRVDGRGWKVYDLDGNLLPQVEPLNYWADLNNVRIVFVAHPRSGGLGLTLTEARMAVFYSNDFNPESRSQAEDRIHRIGMDENRGATIVDLIHLPTDERVLDVLKSNRKLELMTLGDFYED